jgi:3-phosphoglycerate kinase
MSFQCPIINVSFFTLDDYDLTDRTVLLRLDINSPIHPLTGEIMGDTRFRSHIPTIERLRNSRVVILAHQSRPGKSDFISLESHARRLERLLGRRVKFIDSICGTTALGAIRSMKSGDIIMLENTRFFSEDVFFDRDDSELMESSNMVQNLSSVVDVFVNDAFPAIHRHQTSLTGFTYKIPNIAGLLIQKETEAVDNFMHAGVKGCIAILAGAKIEDSISVAHSFIERKLVSRILVGGVVANAFIWASGRDIGKRNEEFIRNNNRHADKYLDICREILMDNRDIIHLPEDLILNPSRRRIDLNEEVPEDQIIADIGPDTIAAFSREIRKAKHIFINGPMGMYEIADYASGTNEILKEVANARALKLAGGGHTISALEMLGLENRIDHISTGGGALISYLSGEPMPVMESLSKSRDKFQDVK